MDLPDLLSRSLQQPDDAWKSMDVIDASDFVYTPLLALEPQYLAYAMLHLHSADGSNEVNVHTGKARRSNSTEVILQYSLVF